MILQAYYKWKTYPIEDYKLAFKVMRELGSPETLLVADVKNVTLYTVLHPSVLEEQEEYEMMFLQQNGFL